MKKVLIIYILISFGLSLFSQEYYYWYNDEKIPLEISPIKKYILVNSPDDTTQLKERLLQRGFQVLAFEFIPLSNMKDKFVQQERDYWTIVESHETLPVLTNDEAILYESPCFMLNNENKEVILTHRLYVKLKQAEDFSVLEDLAKEHNVVIYGNDVDMPLWYILACTKTSKGNALQMANLLYETRRFVAAEPELLTPGDKEASINEPKTSNINIVLVNKSDIFIHSIDDHINHVELFSIDGKHYFDLVYPNVSNVNINISGIKGVFILNVTLQSGNIIQRKILN